MIPLSKTCIHHGELKPEHIKIEKNKTRYQIKCKLCIKDIKKRHYEKNRERILATNAEYRKADPEKIRTIKQNSDRRHREKNRIKRREYKRNYHRQQPPIKKELKNLQKARRRALLYPAYLRYTAKRNYGLEGEIVTNSLLEFLGAKISLWRELKGRDQKQKVHEIENKIGGVRCLLTKKKNMAK